MSPPRSYTFQLFSASQFSQGDSHDPFRFYSDEEAPPLRSPQAVSRLSLGVIDSDGNRSLDSRDRFFYYSSEGRRYFLSSETGLRILNHFLDPNLLRRESSGVLVHSLSSLPEPIAGARDLQSLPEISAARRDEILAREAPYWEADGHLDLDILEGLRVYTREENNRWTGWSGLGIHWNGRYASRKLGVTALIAGGFMMGEHWANSAFMWQTYTTNFLSSIGGSFQQVSRWHGELREGEGLALQGGIAPERRRLFNMRSAEARSRIAQDHLHWAFLTPVVTAACFADPNFRRMLRNPSELFRYFAGQFRTGVPSFLRSPVGWGAALMAGYGIYEVSSAWFEVYGNLRQGSWANRIFSATSTALLSAALWSRVAREMQAMTGSSAFSWSNLMRLRAMRPHLGVLAEIPEGSWLARAWSSSPRVQALFQRSILPTVEVAAMTPQSPLGRYVLNPLGVPRVRFEARLPAWIRPLPSAAEGGAYRAATAESFLLRSSLASEGVAAVEGREAMLLGEEILAARRVRLVGLPFLAVAAGAGLAIGVGYATGYFNENYSPRDLLRTWLGG